MRRSIDDDLRFADSSKDDAFPYGLILAQGLAVAGCLMVIGGLVTLRRRE